ncbi:MAG: hypothetical protein ACOCQN_02585 [Halanaerobiaceae bacterium]
MPDIKNNESISFWSIFKFFLPLGATPFMIGLTHSIINAALARLQFPELSIAIFTVSKSLVAIVSMPTLLSLQLVLTFADNLKSFKKTFKFILIMGATLLSILLLIAYTPLGKWILVTFFELTETRQLNFAYMALHIACFLPVVQLSRNTFQGLALSLKKTKMLLPGIFMRLLSISIFLWWVIRTGFLPGIVAGSLAWIVGIGIEGIFIFLILRYNYGSINNTIVKLPDKNHEPPTFTHLLHFFIPLGIMMSMTSLLQPVIQGNIARSSRPTISLAAYGVSWSIVALLTGPLTRLHQLSIVFLKEGDEDWSKIKLFSLSLGFAISAIVITTAITPLGNLVFQNIMGISAELTEIARNVLLAFSLFPIICSLRESYWGLLMKQRTTSIIGAAKVSNLVTVFMVLIMGITYFHIQPAIMGGLAFTAGELMESLIIWRFISKKNIAVQFSSSGLN